MIEVLSKTDRAIVANYYVSDLNGELIAVLRGVRCQAVPIRRQRHRWICWPCRTSAVDRRVLIVGATGVMARATDVMMHARSQGFRLLAEANPAGAVRLLEGWATTVAYEITTALADDFRLVPDLLIENGRLPVEFSRWFVNLLIHLEAAGLAKQDENGWTLAQDALLPSPESVVKTLANQHPSRAGELLWPGPSPVS